MTQPVLGNISSLCSRLGGWDFSGVEAVGLLAKQLSDGKFIFPATGICFLKTLFPTPGGEVHPGVLLSFLY
jgi:hypothetical protein